MTTAHAIARIRGLDAADVAGKRVLVRADLNVPMANGAVSDATRLERLLPTIRDLAGRGARVVLISHFGRPKGERRADRSLKPVAEALAGLLAGTPVRFVADCVGAEAERAVATLAGGEVAVLENLRFHAGEESDDRDFAAALARLGDLYVNDAFSVSHRAHASTHALARLLPAYAGPQMLAEIGALDMALGTPKRPVGAIIGGAKVSTKIELLTNLACRVDMMIIGGGMANTFLHAQGIDVGKSLCEPDFAHMVGKIYSRAAETGCRIVLPSDAVVAREFKAGAVHQIHPVTAVPADGMILDVGPQSVAEMTERLSGLRTLLWNGPVGAFELAPFGEGTFALAQAAARLTRESGLATIAGGGDTVAALNASGVTGDFTYVSTAGGAFLEWLEGRELPGVAALARQ